MLPAPIRQAKLAQKQKNDQDKKEENFVKRPVDAVSDTIRFGFESIERVLSVRRQPPQSNLDVTGLVGKLASSIESASVNQQAINAALLQSIAGLHQVTEKLHREMTNRTDRPNMD